MARSANNLTAVLQDTADAIKTKKGSSTAICPRDFADEIAGITAGGGSSLETPNVSTFFLSITENDTSESVTISIPDIAFTGSADSANWVNASSGSGTADPIGFLDAIGYSQNKMIVPICTGGTVSVSYPSTVAYGDYYESLTQSDLEGQIPTLASQIEIVSADGYTIGYFNFEFQGGAAS